MTAVLGREAFFHTATSRTSTHAHHVSEHHAATPIILAYVKRYAPISPRTNATIAKKKVPQKYLRSRSKI